MAAGPARHLQPLVVVEVADLDLSGCVLQELLSYPTHKAQQAGFTREEIRELIALDSGHDHHRT